MLKYKMSATVLLMSMALLSSGCGNSSETEKKAEPIKAQELLAWGRTEFIHCVDGRLAKLLMSLQLPIEKDFDKTINSVVRGEALECRAIVVGLSRDLNIGRPTTEAIAMGLNDYLSAVHKTLGGDYGNEKSELSAGKVHDPINDKDWFNGALD